MSDILAVLGNYYVYRNYPINTEEYSSALDLYLTVINLLKNSKIDITDVKILDCVLSGYSYRKSAQILNLDRRTVTRRFKEIVKILGEEL